MAGTTAAAILGPDGRDIDGGSAGSVGNDRLGYGPGATDARIGDDGTDAFLGTTPAGCETIVGVP